MLSGVMKSKNGNKNSNMNGNQNSNINSSKNKNSNFNGSKNKNSNKVMPLGVFVQEQKIYPKNPQKSVHYQLEYPGIKKEIVKIYQNKKTGHIDITFRLLPPKVSKKYSKLSSQSVGKNNESFGDCTKRMLQELSNSNMNNSVKLHTIKKKCKLV